MRGLFIKIHILILCTLAFSQAILTKAFAQSFAGEKCDSCSFDSYGPTQASDPHFYRISNDLIAAILSDNRHRVSSQFQVTPEMKPLVGFWLRIYVQYSVFQTVIFDKENPSIIYGFQDDRDLFRRGVSPIVQELTSKARLKRTLNQYREAFRSLARNPHKKFSLGTPGFQIVHAWGNRIRSKKDWIESEQNLRTQLGQRDRVLRGVQVADRFLSPMEKVFHKYNLPSELTRIPLLESSFIIEAQSKCAAVGVWQFLEKSGKEYLKIDKDRGIDERLSPIKSADAAARMFRRNYKILGDYALSIIAYNHGARNLVKLRHKYGLKNIAKLLDPKNKTSPLGFASRNYYAEFLAILFAERYRNEVYALPFSKNSYDTEIVKLKKPMTIFQIAASYNTTLDDIRSFNPDIFKINGALASGTRVVIPHLLLNQYADSTTAENNGMN